MTAPAKNSSSPESASQWHVIRTNQGADRVIIKSGKGLKIRTGPGNDVVLGNPESTDGIKVLAGKGHEKVFGTSGNDVLKGFGGDDILEGWNGRDTVDGGPGCDLVVGNVGNDKVIGGGVRDACIPGRFRIGSGTPNGGNKLLVYPASRRDVVDCPDENILPSGRYEDRLPLDSAYRERFRSDIDSYIE